MGLWEQVIAQRKKFLKVQRKDIMYQTNDFPKRSLLRISKRIFVLLTFAPT